MKSSLLKDLKHAKMHTLFKAVFKFGMYHRILIYIYIYIYIYINILLMLNPPFYYYIYFKTEDL